MNKSINGFFFFFFFVLPRTLSPNKQSIFFHLRLCYLAFISFPLAQMHEETILKEDSTTVLGGRERME
jgi:hypothetical protein